MCVQHIQCDAIHGGLSAVMRALVRHIHIDTYRRGFPLCINGNHHEFRLAKQSHFIADHDAQRGTWCTKGSSGLKPCITFAPRTPFQTPRVSIPLLLGSGTALCRFQTQTGAKRMTTSPLSQPRQKETSGRRRMVSTSSLWAWWRIQLPFERCL